MQKIIPGFQVEKIDQAFILDQDINSFDLMERAAETFCHWLLGRLDRDASIAVFCGTGNNGGDGLAIARILCSKGFSVKVFYVGNLSRASIDFDLNINILPDHISFEEARTGHLVDFDSNVIIDAVFGVGINRPLEGSQLALIGFLNCLEATKISVDLPSGLPSDDMLKGVAFKADYTVSFQFPKLALLFPEHAEYVGELVVLDIGMGSSHFKDFSGQGFFIQKKDIPGRHIKFNRFSHKGTYGKVMLVGGSYGKMGSINLSCRAALRTGSGLVSCFVPRCGVAILQSGLPEAMVESSVGEFELNKEGLHELGRFDALGVGPGMGTNPDAKVVLEFILQNFQKPIVLDADALNILSSNPHLLVLLRQNMVLTPHLVEFERLVGKCKDHKERIKKAKDFCVDYQCVLVLKGANTLITLPDGKQFFNSSGNQYMATAGSGDTLTGILTSFLGQGYTPENAAVCGVYHHGLAGELASVGKWRGTIASDIIEKIPETFRMLHDSVR